MIKFQSTEEIEQWLLERTSEDPAREAAVLANRQGLRVFPLLLHAQQPPVKPTAIGRLIVAMFRALVLSRLKPEYSKRLWNDSLFSAARSGVFDKSILPNAAMNVAYSTADCAAYVGMRNGKDAAIFAARTAFHESGRLIAQFEQMALGRKIRRIDSLEAISDDCEWLRLGGSIESLLQRSLIGVGYSPSLQKAGHEFWLSLAGFPEAWSNVADWYHRRIKGDESEWGLPPEGDLELGGHLLRADATWWSSVQDDPVKLNAAISQWKSQLRSEAIDTAPLNAMSTLRNEPKVANQIGRITEIASPQPFWNDLGKIDVAKNASYDEVDDEAALQSSLVNLVHLVDVIRPHFANQISVIPQVLDKITQIVAQDGLQSRNQVLLDTLMGVLRVTHQGIDPQELADGVPHLLGEVFHQHERCMAHFERRQERQQIELSIRLSGDQLESEKLGAAMKDLSKAANILAQEGMTTQEFDQTVEAIVETGQGIQELAQFKGNEPTELRTGLVKKWLINSAGFTNRLAQALVAGKAPVSLLDKLNGAMEFAIKAAKLFLSFFAS